MQIKHYFIITYGCQMNENDSERLAGQLRLCGYEYDADMEQADLILINTCCVRESAEKKIYGKIGELKRLKTLNPNLIIGITGCMAQKDREKLFKKAPHIDLILGTHNVHKLAELLQEVKQSKAKVIDIWEEAKLSAPEVPTIRKGNIAAWVPIMYGCNNFCTYCIVPYVRGRERSRPLDDILNEITQLGQEGFKEITLLGQNVNSYGKDTDGSLSFADLLAAVDQIDLIERIRYMTSHPRDLTDEVISVVRSSQKICENFHLPIQSGSDAVLKSMNRGYTTDYYRSLVAKIRENIPSASLTTDIITGFPGETEQQFEETLNFIRDIRFDAAYTFLYSQRSGTPAATMPDQINIVEKKRRLKLLNDAQNEISLEINKQLENTVQDVLVEGTSKNDSSKFMGRTRTNKIVIWEQSGQEQIGMQMQIMINKAQTWVLKGTALTDSSKNRRNI